MLFQSKVSLRLARSTGSFVNRLLSTAVRACIVGAGPAGYYTAQKLLKVGTNSVHQHVILDCR